MTVEEISEVIKLHKTFKQIVALENWNHDFEIIHNHVMKVLYSEQAELEIKEMREHYTHPPA